MRSIRRSSLLRSYVGKAYYEENTKERDALAETQFELAGQLDPNDPTYSFYESILKQSQNRPVEALTSLESAVRKNDNRAVYRSRFLLDDDAAARGATVAAIHYSLGFEKLAIVDSTKALLENAGNHSAHLELANAYANIPRHDITRVSEALQAQIRQPVSVAPINPLLTTDTLLVLRDAGPSQLGTNEFNQLFNRNQFEISAEVLAGSRDTAGGQLFASGLENRFAYSLGALEYKTDGFVDNDHARKSIYDLFLQGQLSAAASFSLNARHSDFAVAHDLYSFFPAASEQFNTSERSDTVRVSGHQIIAPTNDWIWSASYEDRFRQDRTVVDDFAFIDLDAQTYAFELQNIITAGRFQFVSGFGYTNEEDDFFLDDILVSIESANVYSYGQWRSDEHNISVQLGVSGDWFELDNSLFADPIRKDRLNPKFGLVWSPVDGTTLRASAFSTLRRPMIRNQTIEPTQVAGFDQFFTGFDQFFGDQLGSESNRIGVALDQTFPGTVFAGIQLTKRNLEIPELFGGEFEWNEATAHGYLYKTFVIQGTSKWASEWQGAISADVEFEKIDRLALNTGFEGILDLETTRIPIGFRIFSSRGIAVRTTASYVLQEGDFQIFAGFPVVPKRDSAWIVDLSIECRFPRRRGSVLLGANNLFDESVDLVESDPFNPRVATRQLAYLRVSVNF